MAISFIRIDDRIIHGQVVTRWAMEMDCDGILAVNNEAAKNDVLKVALKAASEKKTLIYTVEEFATKMEQAVKSDKNYFLITKDAPTMAKLLVDFDLQTGLKKVNVGPQSARPGTININKNADITQAEAESYEKLHQHGYAIDFRLVPDIKGVSWKDVREKFGFK